MNWKPVVTLVLAQFVHGSPLAAADEAAWKAGVASVVITPDQPMWMAGYASRTNISQGKVHELNNRLNSGVR